MKSKHITDLHKDKPVLLMSYVRVWNLASHSKGSWYTEEDVSENSTSDKNNLSVCLIKHRAKKTDWEVEISSTQSWSGKVLAPVALSQVREPPRTHWGEAGWTPEAVRTL